MEIGLRIKARRKELGLSAEDVAAQIGVSPATVYRYESRDILNMGIDKITPIAKALNTTAAFLMGWSSDSEIQEHDVNFKLKERLIAYADQLNDTNLGRLLERATILLEEQRATGEEVVAEVFHIVEPYVGEFEDEVREIAEKSTKEALEKLVNGSGALAEFSNDNDLGKCD